MNLTVSTELPRISYIYILMGKNSVIWLQVILCPDTLQEKTAFYFLFYLHSATLVLTDLQSAPICPRRSENVGVDMCKPAAYEHFERFVYQCIQSTGPTDRSCYCVPDSLL
jgi:hypothetical protein